MKRETKRKPGSKQIYNRTEPVKNANYQYEKYKFIPNRNQLLK